MINTTKKNPIIGIYKITSPSGRIYIGQSTDIIQRFEKYKSLDGNIKKQPKLYNSFLKYGTKKHHFEILEECNLNLLNEIETWWKLFYGKICVENGLNCSYFDNGRGKHNEYSKLKISNALKGKPKPPGFGENIKNKRIGMKQSEETKQKKILKLKGKPKPSGFKNKISIANSKPILQYDLEGNFIKEWSSITDIYKSLGFHISNISQCCLGKTKTSSGFIWKFKKDEETKPE